MNRGSMESLVGYLKRVPAVTGKIGSGTSDEGLWWVKFHIQLDHPLAWRVVQELGHVLNYLSLDSRLPTVFMPVSPPPYMNGGPRDFLSWVIECKDLNYLPAVCAEWLEGHLPCPVDESAAWHIEDDEASPQ